MKKYVAIIAIALAFASCGDDKEPSDTTVTETTAAQSQLANPASEYCVAQGGTIEIVDESAGQVGYCNLPDGRRIEEWEFYNTDEG